jgi:hypothetical protein
LDDILSFLPYPSIGKCSGIDPYIFRRIRILESIILKFGSGSGRPINKRSAGS